MSNASLNEKATLHNQYANQPTPAPPAYPQVPPVFGVAEAMYDYHAADAGDLDMKAGDRIQIIEKMNQDCMLFPSHLIWNQN
jgi:hypothetical protein